MLLTRLILTRLIFYSLLSQTWFTGVKRKAHPEVRNMCYAVALRARVIARR